MLAVLASAGCSAVTSGVPVSIRESTAAESRLVREALIPLLKALEESEVGPAGCAIGLGVARSPRINASIRRGKTGTCPRFALILTEGSLARLPVGMLRAVLAHELGHVALNHAGRNTQAQEVAADEFAAKLLKRIELSHPEACLQLVYVFSVLADEGAAWFAAHPSPDRRAQTTLARCNE